VCNHPDQEIPTEGQNLLRNSVAAESIYGFAPVAQQAEVQPILEISVSEFESILKDLVSVYNQMAGLVRDAGILRGRELGKLTEDNSRALKAEKSPTTKFLMLNAYIRQLLTKIREALKSRPGEGGKVVQVCSKIMARAVQIIDYVKTYGEDCELQGKRDVSLDSQQARLLFSGKSKERVSRRDTIRAMKRAEALWPSLTCAHRPNDGRQTMRLIIPREDLGCGPEMGYSDLWQRSDRSVALSL
jgi:hypothetical protein